MDDINKSFGGGPEKELHCSKNNYSINAYMLMYRKIDQVRNRNAIDQNEFPSHIKVICCLKF